MDESQEDIIERQNEEIYELKIQIAELRSLTEEYEDVIAELQKENAEKVYL